MTSALVRYIVNGPTGGYYWWNQLAAPFLEDRGWHVIDPATFSYDTSYGFDPTVNLTSEDMVEITYHLQHSSAVVEYHGNPTEDSIIASGIGLHKLGVEIGVIHSD